MSSTARISEDGHLKSPIPQQTQHRWRHPYVPSLALGVGCTQVVLIDGQSQMCAGTAEQHIVEVQPKRTCTLHTEIRASAALRELLRANHDQAEALVFQIEYAELDALTTALETQLAMVLGRKIARYAERELEKEGGADSAGQTSQRSET